MTSRLPRRIDLPSGDELLVREVGPDDLEGLERLYEGLDAGARYRRFFTSYRPDREFFERLVRVADRGGGGLVALSRDPDDDPDDAGSGGAIVGEASYWLLDNGNGEVDVTVDRQWRGWLGPYLLAELAALAAERGIANLEAEILSENRSMRSLTKARGEALRPGSDWHTARVVFATNGPVPSWTPTERPKVLIAARSWAWDAADALEAAGYDVLLCPGPDVRRRPCPLLDHGSCPLARDADAIVVALPESATRDALLEAHRTLNADVPVEVVEPRVGPSSAGERITRAADRALLRGRDGHPGGRDGDR